MMQHKIYAYISDGAVEEEISQGVGRIAGNLGLNNLIMFYDSNDIQLSTECGVVMNEDTEMKYKAWGWNVIKINGNDVAQIREALDAAQKEAVNLVGIVLSCFFYDFLYFFGNFSIGDVEVVLVQRLLILVNVLNVCHIVWVINDCPKVTVCCC